MGRPPITDAQKAMFRAMGQGLKTGGLGNHLVTVHPAQELTSTAFQARRGSTSTWSKGVMPCGTTPTSMAS